MKCLICGRVTLPGAKLCLDCKAARKRAFDATVTQPLLAAAGAARDSTTTRRLLRPSQSVPDAARRAAKMALAARHSTNIATESPSRRTGRWPIMVGAIGIAVLAVGTFGHWFGASQSDTSAAVPVERALMEDRPAASSIVRAAPPSAIAEPAGVAVAAPVANNAQALETTTAATTADAAKRPNVRLRPAKAPVALPPPEPLPAPIIAVAPPPPSVVREAPTPDRWQLMSDAIARCPRDNFFSRVSCEQRLRLQYCDGHWGQVPQCASVPYTTDHGQ